MAKIITEKFKCALCGKESEQNVLASSTHTDAQDLDTRPYGSARHLLKYGVQECPHCGFVNDYIDENPNNVKIFDCTINDLCPSKLASSYFKYARAYERLDNWVEAGHMYLRAAWSFDDEENKEWASKARGESARCFKIYVENTEDGEVAMILVDVYRRCNNFEAALNLISQIGDTGFEDYNSILKFQKFLCKQQDDSSHLMSEAEE